MFELKLLTRNKYNIYGIGSSLLYYSSIFGTHNVYVLYPYFELHEKYFSPRLYNWKDAFENYPKVNLLGRDLL